MCFATTVSTGFPNFMLCPHERHQMVDSKNILKKMKGLLQIAEKNAKIFLYRSRRILKAASKIKKNVYNLVLCGNK